MLSHRRSKCRKPKQPQDGHQKNEKEKHANVVTDKYNEVGFSAITGKKQESSESTWILDSKASEHLTKDKYLLRNIRLLKQPVKIRIAKSGMSLIAKKSGKYRKSC